MMPHVNFDPNSIDWRHFFSEPQVGGAYFRGIAPYQQRGRGIGGIFASGLRFLLPLLKSAGKEVGREGLAVGARVLGDIAKGEEPKSALSAHSKQGLRNLMTKASNKLQQKGSGRKRRRRRRKSIQKGRGTQIHTYRVGGTPSSSSASTISTPKTRKRRRKKTPRQSFTGLFSGRSLTAPTPLVKRRKKRRLRVDSLGVY